MGRPSTPTLGRAGHWKSGGGKPPGPGDDPPGVPGGGPRGPIGPGGPGGRGGGGSLGGIGCRIGGCPEIIHTVHCNHQTHTTVTSINHHIWSTTVVSRNNMSRNLSPLWNGIHYEYQCIMKKRRNYLAFLRGHCHLLGLKSQRYIKVSFHYHKTFEMKQWFYNIIVFIYLKDLKKILLWVLILMSTRPA